uniref:ABC transport system, sugar-binding protein n=1 Tax=uncultured bacterium contig00002 TaxID=1181494 RepID=A0A806KK26_9BACT|nr:ABC transport system, sugar-binding protein [uncultured bacterium contig00002]
MSRRKIPGIINVTTKETKKSIRSLNRFDVFLIILVLLLIVTPIVLNLSFRQKTEAETVKPVNLYLSPRFEELLGAEMTEKLILDFLELYPDLQIQVFNQEEIEDDREPDILIIDEGEYRALAKTGALVELSHYTNYDSGESQLAIPLASFMNLFFYNMDILSAAGFDRPPKTRDEFLAYARAVKNNAGLDGIAGAALSLSPADGQALSRDIFSWIWAAGGNFRTGDERPVINTRTIVNDVSFLGGLYRDGLTASGVFTTTGDWRLEEFAAGKIAMMIASSRAIPYLREKMGDNAFGITTIPVPDTAGSYNIDISGIYAALGANSPYPDEAWLFLVFLAEQSHLLREYFKAVPGLVSDIISDGYIKSDPFYSKAWDIFESSVIVKGFSGTPDEDEYENIFYEEIRAFFESNRTAQETVTAIQRRWDEIYVGRE